MTNKSVLPITALGLAVDGRVYIPNKEDVIYRVEDTATIVIPENTRVSLLDCARNKEISVLISKNAKVTYFILDSCDTKRKFIVEGELEYIEVALKSTKEDLHIELLDEGATVSGKCLCISSDMENHFTQKVFHQRKNTYSNIYNVGVAMHKATVVFDTTGKIEKGMALSKCQQLSKGIIMDDVSTITAKPILLIDEYDCFANHGASIGKMSDEDLFYLMSRGLNKKDAFLLILQGIIQPFIACIEVEQWKDKIEKEVSNLIEK